MQLTTERFDQMKVDKLKRFLEHMAERGQPRPFEIFVDNLKVIPKTEDATEFDHYEDFMSHDTKKIRIVIYNTAASPRNDQYCFLMNGATEESNGLNGIDGHKGFGAIMEEKLNERDRQHEITRLKEKLEETEKSLEEAEDYSEELEGRIKEMEEGRYRKTLDYLSMGAEAVGLMVKRNPAIAQSFPLAGLLAGAGPAAALPAAIQQEDTEASFRPKAAASAEMDENQQGWLSFGQQLESAFKPDELKSIIAIVSTLSQQPDRIPDIIQLLNIQNSNPSL